ncbi:MAG: outer membrane protein assembly factor BamA [Acidobacteria bacterium]|nr:MAG: outer membrane protein assembly factor BamA [Acidobacteriota bacterium]
MREDFRRLWDAGFLEDLILDVQDGTKGKIVIFRVVERKRVQIVDYRGSKALTTTNIEDELKKREATLRVDTFFDMAKARRVEAIIKDMLAEKGRPFATVKIDAKPIGAAGQQVSFMIDDGPKAKVRKIEFTGNKAFSGGALKRHMKNIKQAGFWNLSWLSGKSTYTEDKWSGHQGEPGDQARLQDFYLNHGYVTATIGQPKISYTDGGGKGKKAKKWAKLEIPVVEGDQYRVGEVKFEGLTVFKEVGVRPLFKLQTGDVYNESRLKKGFDKLRDAYGAQGYFQFTGYPKRTPDPKRKVVDVTLTMDEDKRYFVGRILFTGNDTTRDKVIRREVYMNEGDVFNTEALKLSIRRINQLGYFKPMEGPPNIAPSSLGEDKLDVTFKVEEEQNRNQFTFGGGVSGLEGTFLNASFSTANFLGLGETLQLSAQTGARTKNYQLAISEPYLFDRPITAGIDLFKTRLIIPTLDNVVGYTQDSTGASLMLGVRLQRFNQLFTSYAYRIVNIQGLSATSTGVIDPTSPLFDPFFFGQEGRQKESTLTPSFVHNTVDNPWTPRSGVKYTFTTPIAGGPLRGTLDYFRPEAELIFYIPHTRRTALGVRADVAIIIPYANTAKVDPATGRNTLPLYQRFFLGGETEIRGDSENHALGGNKKALFNAEYYIDIAGPLRGVLFFDAGQAFLEGEKIDIRKFRTSTGAEIRFIMPVLNVPFRLIYAFNPNRDHFQPKSAFKFAVGTTF